MSAENEKNADTKPTKLRKKSERWRRRIRNFWCRINSWRCWRSGG